MPNVQKNLATIVIREFCEKNKIDYPEYTFTGTKSPFTCKVELMGLHGSAEAATMQAAKEKAAEELQSKLETDDTEINIIKTVPRLRAALEADSKEPAARPSAASLKVFEEANEFAMNVLKRDGLMNQHNEKKDFPQKISAFSEVEKYCKKMKMSLPVYFVTYGPDDSFTCKVKIHGIKVSVVALNAQKVLTVAAEAMLENLRFLSESENSDKKMRIEVNIKIKQDEPEMPPHVSELKDDLAPGLEMQNQIGSPAVCLLKLYCDKKKIAPIYTFTTDATDKLGSKICELRLENNEVSAKAAKKKTAKELASAKMLKLLEPLS